MDQHITEGNDLRSLGYLLGDVRVVCGKAIHRFPDDFQIAFYSLSEQPIRAILVKRLCAGYIPNERRSIANVLKYTWLT